MSTAPPTDAAPSSPTPASPAAVAPAPAPATANLQITISPTTPTSPASALDDDDAINAPKLSYLALFLKFLGFGIRAWGGPVVQISMMKEQLVQKEKWISNNRFNRVLAVYQVLPGPEATEMACYFGILVHGRIGAILSGLGFILPGFCLMLLLAYIYVEVGLDSEVVFGLFSGLQPAVAAMVFRATHKLADSTLTDVKKEVDWRLGMTALMATFESILKVNFFITLVHCALLYGVFLKPGRNLAGLFVGVLPLAAFIAIVVTLGGFEKLVPMGVGAGALGNNAGTNFLVGLLGGLLTFGGAYTAIPFMQYEAVETGHWVSNTVFLQSLAVGAVLPTPLVMFSTFVGYCANGIVGAVLMTLGMFIPAFSFTVIGHHFFEKVVSARGMLRAALDGVTAGVIGLIAVTAVTLLRAAVRQPLDVVVFMLALGATYHFKSKYTNFMVVIFAGLAGQILYVG